jgi:hypothetical protein
MENGVDKMKSLFQNIRAGIITKPAIEMQLNKFQTDKITLTRTFLANQLGRDLYTKKLAEYNFCIEMLQCVIDKWDDLTLPLKTKDNQLPVGTNQGEN